MLFSADLAPWSPLDVTPSDGQVQALQAVDPIAQTAQNTSHQTSETAAQQLRQALVIVDAGLPDAEALVASFTHSLRAQQMQVEVAWVAAHDTSVAAVRDELLQVFDAAPARDGIYLLGHGETGAMWLGQWRLDAHTLQRDPDLQRELQQALSAEGDLLLYGCSTGAGDAGQTLVMSLAAATGADVAASVDPTGSALQRADWQLELQSGPIDVYQPSDPELQAWAQTLAVTPMAGELLVNSTLGGGQQTTWANARQIGVAADGSAVVVFEDTAGADGSGFGVYMRRIDVNGNVLGTPTVISQTTTGNQYAPVIAMAADGSFTVLWEDEAIDGNGTAVMARRFAADGTPASAEFQVNQTTLGNQGNVAAAYDGVGVLSVVWESQFQDGDLNGIYLRRFDNTGAPLTGEVQVNDVTTGSQYAPDIAVASAGQAVVTWTDSLVDGAGSAVVARLVDNTGAPVGASWTVNQFTTGNQQSSHVTLRADAQQFVVAWHSFGQDGDDEGLMMRRYDSSGTALGNEAALTQATTGFQGNVSLIAQPHGGYVAAWEGDVGGGEGRAVFVRNFAPDASALSDEQIVNATSAGLQGAPSLGVRSNGIVRVVWSGNGASPGQADDAGVFLRDVAANALNYSATTLATSETTGSATLPIALSYAPSADVTVTLSISDATEGALTTTSLTFNASNWNVPQVVGVIGVDDVVLDGAQGYRVQIAAMTSADPLYNGQDPADIVAFNADDEGGLGRSVVVTTTADTLDGTTTSLEALIANPGPDGQISLREAITAANNATNVGGPDRIGFDILSALVGGVHTISPTSALPRLTDSVIIDGRTEPEYAGAPVVVLDGVGAGAADGLRVSTTNVTIAGLTISRFSRVGIVQESGSSTVIANYIGLDPMGTSSWGNSWAGVAVDSGSITIGGLTAAERNVISGNGLGGISLDDPITSGLILGNYLGTNAAGTASIGNAGSGIYVEGHDVEIGNGTAAGRNLIGGNTYAGIQISGAAAQDVKVEGNWIGLASDGVSNLGNGQHGVVIDGGAQTITIGGESDGKGNRIANSGSDGIQVSTNAHAAILRNLITNNGGLAINLVGGVQDGMGVTSNDAAPDADTGANSLQNMPTLTSATMTVGGLQVVGSLQSAFSTSYRIEFFAVPENGADPSNFGEAHRYLGAATVVTDAAGNASINQTLASASVTAGDRVVATATAVLGDGSLTDTSELSSGVAATGVAAGISVVPSGFTTTEAGQTVFVVIGLSAAPMADVTVSLSLSDTSEATLSTAVLTLTPDNWQGVPVTITGRDDTIDDGDISYTLVTSATSSTDPHYNGLVVDDVALTNTDNDTRNVITVNTTRDVTDGNVGSIELLVNNPGADGLISLREALLAANATANSSNGADRVEFEITDPLVAGVHTIALTAALPQITDAVVIDGSTDASFSSTPVIVLDGTAAAGVVHGLEINDTADGSSILNLVIGGFGGDGIHLRTAVTNTTIQGNYIGVMPGTLAAIGNAGTGVFVSGSGANNVIGGINAGEANWIANSGGDGVVVVDVNVGFTSIRGNTMFSNGDLAIDLGNDGVTPNGLFDPWQNYPTFSNASWAGGVLTINGSMPTVPNSTVQVDFYLSATGDASGHGEGTGYIGSRAITANGIGVGTIATTFTVSEPPAGTILTATATDSAGMTSEFSLNITVSTTPNDPPAITSLGAGSTATVQVAENLTAVTTVTATDNNGDTLSFSLSGGADQALFSINPTTGALQFNTAANHESPADANLDNVYEVEVTVSDGRGGTDTQTIAVTVTDAAEGSVQISAPGGLLTTEAGGSATVEVVLSMRPDVDVSIPYVVIDTTEGLLQTGSLTFTPANWSTPQTLTITGVDDAVDDGDINYTLEFGAITSSDVDFNNVDPADQTLTNINNDTAGVSVVPVNTTSSESGGAASFTVALTSQPLADVEISLVSNDTTEGVPQLSSLIFTAANWNQPQTVVVNPADDMIQDGNIAYAVVLAKPSSQDATYQALNPMQVNLINIDDDTAGISVAPASTLTTEAGGTAAIDLILTSQPTSDVTIAITVSDASEANAVTTSVTFTPANWFSPQTVTIQGLDDALADGSQSYQVVLQPAVSADPVYNGMDPTDVTMSNADNELVGIIVTPQDSDSSEAGGTAMFQVVLASQPTADVHVPVSSSDLTEGSVAISELVFTAANWNVPQQVVVTGVNDALIDGTVSYSAVLGVSTSADSSYNGLNPDDVALQNVDNDAAGVIVTPISSTTTEAGGTATFTVVLAGAPTATVVIPVTTNSSVESRISTPTLYFTTANWSTPQTVTVTGQDDFWDDGDVNYLAILDPVQSTDGNYNGINPSDVPLTNIDDDTAGITVTQLGPTTSEDGAQATFTVVLNSRPFNSVTIPVSSSDASEGTASVASLVFTTANWNTPQTVTVTGVDDLIADGDQAYQIVLGAPTSNDTTYRAINPNDIALTNFDDEQPGLVITPTGTQTTEAGGTVSMSVQLTSQPVADVTVPVSSSDLSEGTVSVSALVFTPANWNIAQTVVVTGVDDAMQDGTIGYNLVFGAFSSSDTSYNAVDPADMALQNVDNDTASIVLGIASNQTSETGSSLNVNVQLATQPSADVTVAVTVDDPTEASLSVATLTFTAANWNQPQVVQITGLNDDVDDGDQTFRLQLQAAQSTDPNYNGLITPDVFLTNVDDDQAAVIVTPLSGLMTSEAGGSTSFSVVLGSQPLSDITLAVNLADTTEGQVSTASLVFTPANWATPQTVTVTGVNDAIDDGDQAYTLTLLPLVGDDAYRNVVAQQFNLTNTDDDTAALIVTPIDSETSEAGGTGSFQVVLATQPVGDVTVSVVSDNPSEGTPSVSSLVFTAANWNQPRTVTVTGADDPTVDGTVPYAIRLTPSSTADTVYNAMPVQTVALQNTDDDQIGLAVTTLNATSSEFGAMASFSVALRSRPTADVTVAVSSTDGTEGAPGVAQLTFTPATWNIAQTVTVAGINDQLADGNIAYRVQLQASSADAAYNALPVELVELTNLDDDVPAINVGQPSAAVTTEVGGSVSFTVVLQTQPTADVTVPVVSTQPGEGQVSVGSLTFTPVNWNQPQTVTVTGVDDGRADGDQAYQIQLGVASSADPNYNGMNPADIALSNRDDDAAGVVVSPVDLVTSEAGDTGRFTVVLRSQPSADVTIALVSSDPNEGQLSVASLTFTPATWNIAQTVIVTGRDDAIDDGDRSYTVQLQAASSADAQYNGQTAAPLALSNTDNDQAGVTVTAGSNQTTEAGGTATMTVVLQSQPTADVLIGVSSSNTAEARVSTASLIFTAANWNQPQTITVTGVDDDVADDAQPYSVVLAPAVSLDTNYSGRDARDVSLSNLDDDVPALFVTAGPQTLAEGGSTQTITVQLASRPGGGPVTVQLSLDDTAQAQLSATTLNFSGANWNVPQTVTLTAVDDSVVDGARPVRVSAVALSGDSRYQGLTGSVTVSAGDNDRQSQIEVTTAQDLSDGDVSSLAALLSNPGADGLISLREALQAANATPNGPAGPDQIRFNLPASADGSYRINLASALPQLTDAIDIDGSSQPGLPVGGLTQIDGAALTGAADGLSFVAGSDGSRVTRLALTNMPGAGVRAVGIAGLIIDNARLTGHGEGVVVGEGATGVSLPGSRISGNDGLAVRLGGTAGSLTPVVNDAGDADTGPNDLLNHPRLLSAVLGSDGVVTVTGEISSSPNTTLMVQLFRSASLSALTSPWGDGEVLAGSVNVTTDAQGASSFTLRLNNAGGSTATAWASGMAVTANATTVAANPLLQQTSGFSQRVFVNTAANLTLPDPATDYAENAGLIPVQPQAVLTDADSANFDGGWLQVQMQQIVLSQERLEIINQGTGPGQISVSNGVVSFGGVAIGELSMTATGVEVPWGNQSLVQGRVMIRVDFHANATPQAVQALVRAVGFANDSDDPLPGTRTLSWQLFDGDSVETSVSGAAAGQVRVQASNDAPVLTVPTALTVAEDGVIALAAGAVGVTGGAGSGGALAIADIDAQNLPMQLQLATTNGVLAWANLTGVTVVAGRNDSAAITLTGSRDALNQVLAGLSLRPSANFAGTAQISVQISDQGASGDGTTAVSGTSAATGTPLARSATIAVNVVPVNDLPQIASSSTWTIVENASAVGALTGTDVEPGALRWSLAGGADQQRFAIDPSTGALRMIAAADFEAPTDANADNRYELLVALTDDQGAVVTQQLVVTVTNLAEAPTSAGPAQARIDENVNASNGLTVASLTANDPDIDDTQAWSITGGADAAMFRLAGNQLILQTSGVDFEARARYALQLQAVDRDGLSISLPFELLVNDLPETPTLPAATLSVTENAAIGTEIGRITAQDPDTADVLRYSLDDAAGGRFAIDPQTGVLRVATAADSGLLNFEAAPTSTVTIRATDASGLSTTRAYLVRLTDLNDPPVLSSPVAVVTDDATPVALQGDAAITVSDEDADAAAAQRRFDVTLGVDRGALWLPAAGQALVVSGSGSLTEPLRLRGTLTELAGAINALVYRPTLGAVGEVTLEVTTQDSGAGLAGQAFLVKQKVLLGVFPSASVTPTIAPSSTNTGSTGGLAGSDSSPASGGGLNSLSSVGAATQGLTTPAATDSNASTSSSTASAAPAGSASAAVASLQQRLSTIAATSQSNQSTSSIASASGSSGSGSSSVVGGRTTSREVVVLGAAGDALAGASGGMTMNTNTESGDDGEGGSDANRRDRRLRLLSEVSVKTFGQQADDVRRTGGQESKGVVSVLDNRTFGLVGANWALNQLSPFDAAADSYSARSSIRIDLASASNRQVDPMDVVQIEEETGTQQGATQRMTDIEIEPTEAGGVALSFGMLWWALKSGGLVSAFLAGIPALRTFDPLPMLGSVDGGAAGDARRGARHGDGADDREEAAVAGMFSTRPTEAAMMR